MSFDFAQSGLAFAEGLGLALSPCILPILPFILAGSVQKNRAQPFLIIAGFVISFTIFSLLIRQLIALTGVDQEAIQQGAFALLLIFGLVMVIPWLEERFATLTGGLADKAQSVDLNKNDTVLGGLLMGALIGLIWTPCAGPLLAAALLQVIQADTNVSAIVSIFAFALGAGVPMLIIALSGQHLTQQIRALSRHATAIRRVMGVVIIGFALLGLSGFNLGVWVATRGEPMQVAQIESDTLKNGLSAPYAAPQIAGITQWFNSAPLTTESLKGKVVLIDFWTYSCINCIRTLPHIKDWAEKYGNDGLVVIGVHAPEFAFEGKPENVQKAIEKFGITYPVAMDNDFVTWNNFKNQYWPAHYLINKEGQVVYTHFGEGEYDVTEGNIRFLLGLGKSDDMAKAEEVISDGQTPETYLGTARAEREAPSGDLPLHNWRLSGDWKRTPEYVEAQKAGDTLTLHYNARKVFLVMESADGKPVQATIKSNDEPTDTVDVKKGGAEISTSRLYELLDGSSVHNGTVSITANAPGLRLFAFTFES